MIRQNSKWYEMKNNYRVLRQKHDKKLFKNWGEHMYTNACKSKKS